MEEVQHGAEIQKILSHFPQRSPVNLEFQDLTYTVPQGRKGSKLILRSISGQFRSGHLSAILGPSGAGKSTLLNVLAGYKTIGAAGSLMMNGQPLNLKQFRKLSRYIMQQDLLQPMLTVQEAMMFAADLKLNRELSKEDKLIAISEILEMLRLTGTKDTSCDKISGGERKRVSIALELINNPPVIFLDEPTSGLDDLSSSQCISLLKGLAEGGRTVICSIHTPSARIFEKFDHVYIISEGLCVYQGYGKNMITYMTNLGLTCPKHYNPADFIIEVSSGEYGIEYVEKMSTAVENGRNVSFAKESSAKFEVMELDNDTYCNSAKVPQKRCSIRLNPYKYDCSFLYQFKILFYRCCLQTYRNKQYLILKVVVHVILGLILGAFYFDMGQDASKALFNFGFCYTCTIGFMYLPLMPVLLHFPTEIQLIKREHFNRWYGLSSYYLAMSLATLPIHAILTFVYIGIAYVMTSQPMELDRFLLFIVACSLISFVSDSLGLMIASVSSIVNGMFLGPVTVAPLMLLAVYGIGHGSQIPILIRIAMYFSYLRYGMESLITVIYGFDRGYIDCPEEELICPFRDPQVLLSFMGMENIILWVDFIALIIWFLIFRFISFYLLRQRLQPNKTFAYLQVIGRLIKSHLGMTR